MDLVVNRLLDAISAGSVYALIGAALVIVFRSSQLINFAQAELASVGAFLASVLAVEQGWPVSLAVIAAVVISAMLGSVVYRFLVRPVPATDHLGQVMVVIGVLLAVGGIAGIVWGYDGRRFPAMAPAGGPIAIAGVTITWSALVSLAVVAALGWSAWWVTNRTKVGLAYVAVSADARSAQLSGIDPDAVRSKAWAVAGAIGAIGGCLFVADPVRSLEPTALARVLIFASAAAAIGGLRSVGGALAGGLGVGVVDEVVVPSVDWIPDELSIVAATFVLIATLTFAPDGLLARRQVRRL